MAAKLAVAYWRDKVPEHMRDDPVAAGRRVNGGDNGKDARVVSSRQWARIITPELVQDILSGRTTLEQLATGESQSQNDPVIRALQHNLNTLGITDARGQSLLQDGNRGGPDSHTNEAIAAFQQRYGIEGRLSNSELLIASQAVLRTQQALDFNRSVTEGAPAPEHAVRMVDGAPDYLVPGQAPADAGAPAPPAPAGRYADGIQPPSASKDAQSDGVLQRGASGPQVRALQEQLILLGARDRNGELLRADSQFGDRTKEAVEQFQLWTGRETTGMADPDTVEALQEHAQFASRQRAQGVAPSQRHLVDNLMPTAPDLADAADLRTPQERNAIQNPAAFEQGRAIADVQAGLIQLGYQHRTTQPLTVNGVNDEATRQAVTAFQAQNDLPLSGQADQATRQALQQALLRQQQARQEEEAKRQEQDKRRGDDPTRQASDPLAAPSQATKAANVQDHAGVRDLREQLCERLEQKGQLTGLSDDRLTELAGQMYQAGLRADMRFDATVDGDRFFASASDITHAGKHTSLDLSQPPASPQETLQAVARYDRQQAELAAQQPMPDEPSRGRSM